MSGIAALAPARRIARRVLDVLLPPRCLSCGVLVAESGGLCGECWPRLSFIGPPHCACCGLPFDFEAGAGALCGACSAQPPSYARARAVLRYDEASRALVLGFKHGDRTHAAPAFARWMGRAGDALLRDADAVVPVPLHWTRLFTRRYNQAALLANALAALGGPPAGVDWLRRRRRTPSQGHLSREARRTNVRGAFVVSRRGAAAVSGRRILLVDDVLTTGATVEACARALKRAGAAEVDVLTLARVTP